MASSAGAFSATTTIVLLLATTKFASAAHLGDGEAKNAGQQLAQECRAAAALEAEPQAAPEQSAQADVALRKAVDRDKQADTAWKAVMDAGGCVEVAEKAARAVREALLPSAQSLPWQMMAGRSNDASKQKALLAGTQTSYSRQKADQKAALDTSQSQWDQDRRASLAGLAKVPDPAKKHFLHLVADLEKSTTTVLPAAVATTTSDLVSTTTTPLATVATTTSVILASTTRPSTTADVSELLDTLANLTNLTSVTNLPNTTHHWLHLVRDLEKNNTLPPALAHKWLHLVKDLDPKVTEPPSTTLPSTTPPLSTTLPPSTSPLPSTTLVETTPPPSTTPPPTTAAPDKLLDSLSTVLTTTAPNTTTTGKSGVFRLGPSAGS